MKPAEDPDAVVRDLLRQAPPSGVDAARAARVRAAVHDAWQDAAVISAGAGARRRNRRVMLAIAAVFVSAVALTLLSLLRERAVPAPAAAMASTLFLTSEVVFEQDGQ